MRSTIKIISDTIRIRQWFKNVLILFAPLAAGVDPSIDNFLLILFGFLAFAFVSSIGYIFNDIMDMEVDSSHPIKLSRPYASKLITFNQLMVLVLPLLLASVYLSTFTPLRFNLVLVIYLLNSILYTSWGKRIPLVDIFQVAFGFILRLIAGALLLNLSISKWFLIVGGFGALMIVAAKRLQELKLGIKKNGRIVLAEYSPHFLRAVINISVAIITTSYSYWAFEQAENPIWYQFSIVPFIFGVFKFLLVSEREIAEFPEQALLKDKGFWILGILHISILVKAIYF